MSVAEIVDPIPRVGNYQLTRFNAVRHGVLSQYTVLPWEDGEEYGALIEALAREHGPQGPTEEHLVEELAGIIWRKRRLRLAERAVHHRALKHAADGHHETAKAALVHVAGSGKPEPVAEAIRADDRETAEELAHIYSGLAAAEKALGLLKPALPAAYVSALAALHDDTRSWWEEQLSLKRGDREQGERPFRPDAESLTRFLAERVLPWYDERRQQLKNRPLIRAQAFGEAVDPHRLERLARYEVHLDRKLERTLAMLLRLQDIRRAGHAGSSVSQNE